MALIIELKVMVQSGRQEIVLDKSGILKCFILAAPENGKANKEIVALFAQKLNIKKQQVEIVGGLISNRKKLAFDVTLSHEEFLQCLGLSCQTALFKKTN